MLIGWLLGSFWPMAGMGWDGPVGGVLYVFGFLPPRVYLNSMWLRLAEKSVSSNVFAVFVLFVNL